jgi:acyl carrier protein
LPADEGLALFDTTPAQAAVVPVRLDLGALRAAPEVPHLLRGLVRPRARRSAPAAPAPGAVTSALTAASPADRPGLLLDVISRHAAAVLGHDGGTTLEPQRRFSDLGFDSLMAVEFRNRLSADLGRRMAAGMLFDYPTPAELVDHLLPTLVGDEPTGAAALLADLDRLEQALGETTVDDERIHRQIAGRLEVLRAKWSTDRDDAQPGEDGFDLGAASDDDMFKLLDDELGLA